MLEMLMWLYEGGKGKLTVPMLVNAVIKGWITDVEKIDILATQK